MISRLLEELMQKMKNFQDMFEEVVEVLEAGIY